MKADWANKQEEYQKTVEERAELRKTVEVLQKENESLQVIVLQVREMAWYYCTTLVQRDSFCSVLRFGELLPTTHNSTPLFNRLLTRKEMRAIALPTATRINSRRWRKSFGLLR